MEERNSVRSGQNNRINRTSSSRTSGGGSSPSMQKAKQKRARQRARRRRQRILIKLGLLAVVFLIFWILMTVALKKSVAKVITDDTTIAAGVTIDGVDVGGMTKAQAVQAVEAHVTQVGEAQINCITADGQAAISLNSLGFRIKDQTAEELAEQAFNYGRKGSLVKRYRQTKKLKRKTVDFAIENFTIDETMAAEALKEHCKVIEGAAENAAIVKVGDSDEVTITESKNGIAVDTETTIASIRKIVESDKWNREGCDLEVAIHEAEPEVTTEFLQSLSDELGSYSTYYEGLSAKMQNVENAASLINGHIVQPGEEFDTNAAMEPYTEENGYTEGRSFNSGTVEETIGGGICQVSTTLYNAVLYSELEVTQRDCHSMIVNYVEAARDAAIADDVKNLVFKNNTNNPIYIEAHTADSYLYISIYGVDERDPGHRIEFYTDETKRVECKVKFYADYDEAYGTKTTETYGYDGVDAVLYKNTYENDVLVNTETVNYSNYNLVDAVVKVGVKTDDTDAQNALLEAIASQDEDKVNSYCY